MCKRRQQSDSVANHHHDSKAQSIGPNPAPPPSMADEKLTLPSAPRNLASTHMQTPAPESGPDRKFFYNVEPIFSVAVPTRQLIFLDNADPAKDIVVRKKAREWVHRKKERQTVAPEKSEQELKERRIAAGSSAKPRGIQRRLQVVSAPLRDIAAGMSDPFDMLPKVGRNIDHIIEYFLTSCPEEIPCSDDKYAWRPRQQSLLPAKENSVMWNMAEARISFVTWLFATTLIRDGMTGNWLSEETQWFYMLSLKTMRETLNTNKEIEVTDSILCALACFTATANFAGMYQAADLHRDALIKAATLKGGGDLVTGLFKCKRWTRKAIQWCEFQVAAQNRELPQIPYIPPSLDTPFPPLLISEADRLTSVTLSRIPSVSHTFFDVFRLLHQLALIEAQRRLPSPALSPIQTKSETLRIRSMYDVEYKLLQILSAMQTASHAYAEVEILLAETCQLYMLVGARGLPPQAKTCDLFVSWIKEALFPVLRARSSRALVASQEHEVEPSSIKESRPANDRPESSHRSTELDCVILWGLHIGTVIAKVHSRSEYEWFCQNLHMQMQQMGLKSREALARVLNVFPSVDRYEWINIEKLGFCFEE